MTNTIIRFGKAYILASTITSINSVDVIGKDKFYPSDVDEYYLVVSQQGSLSPLTEKFDTREEREQMRFELTRLWSDSIGAEIA